MSIKSAKKNINPAVNELWRIAETGDAPALESVLSTGVDIDASNSHGMTALMRAASHGRIEMVRALLKNGADPNRARNDKFTALVLAAFFGHEEIVRILVAHGADMEAVTRFGTSAQGWASARTFPEVVQYLKSAGAADEKLAKETEGRISKSQSAKQSASPTVTASFAELRPSTPVKAVATPDKSPDTFSTSPSNLPFTTPLMDSFEELKGFAPAAPGQIANESISKQDALDMFPGIRATASPHVYRRRVVYAFATLLLAFTLIADLTLRNAPRVEPVPPQTRATVSTDAVIIPAKTVDPPQPITGALDMKPDGIPVKNDMDSSPKSREKSSNAVATVGARSVISTRDFDRHAVSQKHVEGNSISPPLPSPADIKVVANTDEAMAAAPVTGTAKPNAMLHHETAPKKKVEPLTIQLLSPTKNADKARVIQWP